VLSQSRAGVGGSAGVPNGSQASAPYETAFSGDGTSYMSDGTTRFDPNWQRKPVAPAPTPAPTGASMGGGGYGLILNPQTGAWESNSQGGGITPDPRSFTGFGGQTADLTGTGYENANYY